jgi:hypothetical protein
MPLLVAFLIMTTGMMVFLALYTYPQQIRGLGFLVLHGDLKQILSPVSGTIEEWLKEEGDAVKAQEDVVAILSNDDRNIKRVSSKVDGVIAEIIAYPDTSVSINQPLAIITNQGDVRNDLEVIAFVSSLDGKKIEPGMKALIDPSIIDPARQGHLKGEVKRVGKLPMSKAALLSLVKIPELAKYIRERIEAEPFVVILSLAKDSEHKTGYQWSGPGPNFLLDSGIIADIFVIIAEPTILSILLPSLFSSDLRDK